MNIEMTSVACCQLYTCALPCLMKETLDSTVPWMLMTAGPAVTMMTAVLAVTDGMLTMNFWNRKLRFMTSQKMRVMFYTVWCLFLLLSDIMKNKANACDNRMLCVGACMYVYDLIYIAKWYYYTYINLVKVINPVWLRFF